MDWKHLISELQSAGLTQQAIGESVGRSQAWVADILRGRIPDVKWGDGQALIELHSNRENFRPKQSGSPSSDSAMG